MFDNIFGAANVMLDKLLGISKATFVKEKVVPANDKDVFNDNRCAFCWGPYDEDHPGARVLPCNHVFGRDCLTQMINTTNGNHCSVCQTLWFRPDLHVAVGRWLADGLTRMLLCLIMATHKLDAKLYKLENKIEVAAGYPLQWFLHQILVFYLHSNNIMYYAALVSDNFTNLRVRNPQLNLKFVAFLTWLPTRQVQSCYLAYVSSSAMFPQPLLNSLCSLISAVSASLAITEVFDNLTSHKDIYLFAGILLSSAMIQFFVRTIMATWCPFLL
ncbi:hypothetical protein BDU57DRAFT_540374 [Ampelomyces quisqualis]|uniref:RING-type domain-containing protein n=1 Tax=Ampelomyces quisqualis TaxID=50730 RepID=A0A6A5QIB0_AMPQU|nr:hypothetical protein BDU57DRAFT_540374 [Ampelomyces quisqualis]